jgi:PAS domain S-box-containing protein
MNFNETLERQIKKYIDDDLMQHPGLQKLLHAVNDTYNNFDNEKDPNESNYWLAEMNFFEERHLEIYNPDLDTLNASEIAASPGNSPAVYNNTGDELAFFEREKKRKIIHSSLNTLISSLQNAILLLDDAGNVLYINYFFCNMFGLSAATDLLIGKHVTYFDRSISKLIKQVHFNERIAKSIPANKDKKVNYRLDLNDHRIIDCNIIPITDEGQRIGQLRTYTDVTESIKSKEILHDNKKLTEEILDNIPADIALFDAQHRYLYVNPNGIKDEEMRKALIGKDDFDYYRMRGADDSKAKKRRALFNQAVERKIAIDWLDEYKKPGGESKFVLRRYTPYFEDDELKYVFGYAVDVTDLKRYENELQKKNSELERLNSELDAFVYSTSHNLRSPLTSIKGLIDLIALDEPTGKELATYIDKINTSIARLDGTIYDIIEYSKNSRLDLAPSLIDVEELINHAYADVQFFNKGRVELALQSNITAPFYAEKKRITSVVSNIISNSVKYADESKANSFIKINVNIDESRCEIVFTDNGIGIPEDKHQKVFEMFYRNTNKTFGSGLGLFIVKEMVTKLNGTITLESCEGEGTTICLSIPNNIYAESAG